MPLLTKVQAYIKNLQNLSQNIIVIAETQDFATRLTQFFQLHNFSVTIIKHSELFKLENLINLRQANYAIFCYSTDYKLPIISQQDTRATLLESFIGFFDKNLGKACTLKRLSSKINALSTLMMLEFLELNYSILLQAHNTNNALAKLQFYSSSDSGDGRKFFGRKMRDSMKKINDDISQIEKYVEFLEQFLPFCSPKFISSVHIHEGQDSTREGVTLGSSLDNIERLRQEITGYSSEQPKSLNLSKKLSLDYLSGKQSLMSTLLQLCTLKVYNFFVKIYQYASDVLHRFINLVKPKVNEPNFEYISSSTQNPSPVASPKKSLNGKRVGIFFKNAGRDFGKIINKMGNTYPASSKDPISISLQPK